MQTTSREKLSLAMVGEEISHELGAQMIKSYQVANTTDVKWYYVGKHIINEILAQPGCVGIRFYNAYNENGEKTLVYIGVDENGKDIVYHTIVTAAGALLNQKAIVADRIKTKVNDDEATENETSWFDWIFS